MNHCNGNYGGLEGGSDVSSIDRYTRGELSGSLLGIEHRED
jgi:hypothetical protein